MWAQRWPRAGRGSGGEPRVAGGCLTTRNEEQPLLASRASGAPARTCILMPPGWSFPEQGVRSGVRSGPRERSR
eukprot:4961149-Pyramimonas_sp.AAC.1